MYGIEKHNGGDLGVIRAFSRLAVRDVRQHAYQRLDWPSVIVVRKVVPCLYARH